jgi:hypothetical protein
MIDNASAPEGWRTFHAWQDRQGNGPVHYYAGPQRILCAAHAEARFGAALYRDPLPAQPLRDEEWKRSGGCDVCGAH